MARQAEEDLERDGEEGDWGSEYGDEQRPQQGNAAASEAADGNAEASNEEDSDGDMTAGFKGSGFRYRQVPKADYGLSIQDMLTMDPKELNQVGLSSDCCSMRSILTAGTWPTSQTDCLQLWPMLH